MCASCCLALNCVYLDNLLLSFLCCRVFLRDLVMESPYDSDMPFSAQTQKHTLTSKSSPKKKTKKRKKDPIKSESKHTKTSNTVNFSSTLPSTSEGFGCNVKPFGLDAEDQFKPVDNQSHLVLSKEALSFSTSPRDFNPVEKSESFSVQESGEVTVSSSPPLNVQASNSSTSYLPRTEPISDQDDSLEDLVAVQSDGFQMLVPKKIALAKGWLFSRADIAPSPNQNSEFCDSIRALQSQVTNLQNQLMFSQHVPTDPSDPDSLESKQSASRMFNLSVLEELCNEDVVSAEEDESRDESLPHQVNRGRKPKRLKFNRTIVKSLDRASRLLRSSKLNKVRKFSELNDQSKVTDMLFTSEGFKVVRGSVNWPLPPKFSEVPIQESSSLPTAHKNQMRIGSGYFKEPQFFKVFTSQSRELEKLVFDALVSVSMVMSSVNSLSKNLGERSDGEFVFYPDDSSDLKQREQLLGILCSSAKVSSDLLAELKANLMALSRDQFLAKSDFRDRESNLLRSLPFDPDSLFPVKEFNEVLTVRQDRRKEDKERPVIDKVYSARQDSTSKFSTPRGSLAFRGKKVRFTPSTFSSKQVRGETTSSPMTNQPARSHSSDSFQQSFRSQRGRGSMLAFGRGSRGSRGGSRY